jgi:hypothetical protein
VLESIGHDHFATSSFAFLRRVARAFWRTRDVYWLGTTWFGRSLFSIVEAEYADLPGGRIQETLTIPSNYRDCPQLFHILRGALRAAPHVMGEEDALVEMVLEPREAVYTITPPPRQELLRRLARRLRAPLNMRSMIDELAEQQELIARSNRGLRVAQGKIAAQAEELQRINAIGHELAQHIELEPLTEALINLLHKHHRARGVALWLRSLDGDEEALLCQDGATSGPPSRTHSLETANRPVGRLELWGDDPSPERPDLLDKLVSWISIALDNARSYSALAGKLSLSEAQLHTAQTPDRNDD